MHPEHLLTELTAAGHRLTPVRKALVGIFAAATGPVVVEDLFGLLETEGLRPNKTTIYRELDFLQEQGIIHELDFGEGKKRYEASHHGHHHHLICTNCKKIEEIELTESGLAAEETKILQERGFRVSRHMLEFFGLCRDCA